VISTGLNLKRTLAVAAVGLSALTGLTPVAMAHDNAATVNMVALGDSYGSGTGAGDYFPGTEGSCFRSRNSAPELIAGTLRNRGANVQLANVTCSGASTADLRQTFKGQPPQLNALRPDTTLVTLSIGTNDVNFADYGGLCIQADCSGPATDTVINQTFTMRQKVTNLLVDIRNRSPRANVVVTGYGTQLTEGKNAQGIQLDPVCADGVFTPQERVDGNRAARAIDLNLRVAVLLAQLRGVRSTFVSPYTNSFSLAPEFAGHSLCESGTPFYRGFDALAPGQEGPEAVFHLNKAGQAALASLASRRI
jgi:lysophospholipase L1-like esterase